MIVLDYYKVIRQTIMDYRTLLNENQYKAVSIDKQYVRVVAGAGSGKTRVLTYRISYLISEKHVSPRSIVAIAFTNKVALEMRNRALSILKSEGDGLTVSTFHSFCARFLRREINSIGFPNNFTIFDDEDSEKLIKDIGSELGYKRNDDIVKHAISFIAYHKCIGKYPEDIEVGKLRYEGDKTAHKIFKIYEEKKNQNLSLDFDDLLLKTIHILQSFPEIRIKWQNRISNILVDEFQDTNDIQYRLLKLLMNEKTALYVVGDPDQTIYTWRGANQNIILNFDRDFKNAETIILDRNYRSTKNILDSANKLIAYNKKRVPKNLYTENSDGDSVLYRQFISLNYEAKYVVDEIERLHYVENVPFKDIAILYRASYLTLPFENNLMSQKIPYQIYGGLKFFQRKEIKDLIAYFHLLYNEKDDVSFERIINVPRRGFGEQSLEILKGEKDELKLSYLEYIDEIDNHQTSLKRRHVEALKNLLSLIKATRAKLKENLEAYPKILEKFVDEINYNSFLMLDEEKGDERINNVKSLFENINNFSKDNPGSSFDEYLNNVALQTSQDEIKDIDQVSLMTIHVAKGLEFKYVFLVSVVDGVFPSHRTIEENDDGLEEERRLCYVAFTRAKEKLYVTANTGFSFILQDFSRCSQFVEEAGLLPKPSAQKKPIFKKKQSNIFDGFDDSSDDFYPDLNQKEATDFFLDENENSLDWQIGDLVNHDTFGDGVVKKVQDGGTIIVVDFYSSGLKTLMANHPKVHKKGVRGGAIA